jgi:hypothetical protein
VINRFAAAPKVFPLMLTKYKPASMFSKPVTRIPLFFEEYIVSIVLTTFPTEFTIEIVNNPSGLLHSNAHKKIPSLTGLGIISKCEDLV